MPASRQAGFRAFWFGLVPRWRASIGINSCVPGGRGRRLWCSIGERSAGAESDLRRRGLAVRYGDRPQPVARRAEPRGWAEEEAVESRTGSDQCPPGVVEAHAPGTARPRRDGNDAATAATPADEDALGDERHRCRARQPEADRPRRRTP